ncbi:hypothetical protein NPIL_626831 [Nephila pilipes]|uniref:Uncharacterized protein n=1 Tax=Nephila pilipes TaxID=299642 RepID=A0A8X6PJR9_NEPPI|nr:hypothetical protein NPIL_626831 [Nephila pilipes]
MGGGAVDVRVTSEILELPGRDLGASDTNEIFSDHGIFEGGGTLGSQAESYDSKVPSAKHCCAENELLFFIDEDAEELGFQCRANILPISCENVPLFISIAP